jgi:hypothetical protein
MIRQILGSVSQFEKAMLVIEPDIDRVTGGMLLAHTRGYESQRAQPQRTLRDMHLAQTPCAKWVGRNERRSVHGKAIQQAVAAGAPQVRL